MPHKIISKSKNISLDKSIYFAMLCLNFFCLFEEQQLNNLSSMVCFFPNAYLNNSIKNNF